MDKENIIFLLKRYGILLIPFLLTLISGLIAKTTGEPHATRAMIAAYVFLGLFASALVYWIVRIVIYWVELYKEWKNRK